MSSVTDSFGASPDSDSRRGIQLPHIRKSFNDTLAQRFQRPRPMETAITEKSTMHMPTQEESPLHRRKSKGGLLWLFGRKKSSTKSSLKLATSLQGKETSTSPLVTNRTSGSFQNRAPLVAHEVRVSSPLSTGSSTALQHQTSRPILKANPDRDPLVKPLASWHPPELFKAYPQATKHARLRAPTAQVKAILQLHEEKKIACLEQDLEQSVALENAKNEGVKKKREKDRGSKRSTLEITSNDGWVEKVYVLATSGYLLEYAGDGAFDRLPEKLMPLGKESAAFASDAIAGEHWVLQVSRIVNDDGIIPSEGPKSIFRKLGFGNDLRGSTSAFLLMFDSPEDMNSWLVAIRKEIEGLGGRKYRPDVGMRRTNDEIARQLRERPSRRYFIKREPDRFRDQLSDPSFEGMADKMQWVKARDHESLTITGRRPSMTTQKSTDSPSASNATISSDQAFLERLKETPRMSYVSAGTKTWSTSRGSSLEPSPARAPFSPEDLIPKPLEDKKDTPQISRARSSMQQVPASTPIVSPKHDVDIERGPGLPPAFSMARSTADRTSSPPPPSFGVPSFSVPSFSKRYSGVTIPAPLSPSTSGSNTNDHGAPLLTASNEHHGLSVEEKSRRGGPVQHSFPRDITKSTDVHTDSSLLHSFTSSDRNSLHLKSDHLVSRRFSSLDFTRDTCSRDLESAQSPFPHPPPTTALPALPRHQLLPLSSQNHIQDQRCSSGNVESIRKKRRPVSMQAHSDPTTRHRYRPPKIGLQHPSEMDEYSLSAPVTTIPKPRRAPPPPPLSLVQAPEVRRHRSPPQVIRPLPGDSFSEFRSLADVPSFFNSENNPLGSLEGPWNTSYSGRLPEMRVK